MSKWVLFAFLSGVSSALLGVESQMETERLPGHEESWIALVIVAGSILSAWFLNHRAPRVRVTGTLLAASGCLAVAIWFFGFVLGSGFVEQPKPGETPLDLAKPTLLWTQCSLALLAGLGLLVNAARLARSDSQLNLTANNEADRYGLVSRVLHWTIAMLFIVMIPMGIFATMIPEGTPYRLEYYVVHKTIGVTIFALVILRVIWNFRSRRPDLDPHLKPVERKLAHAAHFALYLLMFALPVTGFIMTSYFGAPTYFFIWEMQPLWAPSDTAIFLWGVLHKYLLPYLVYVILGAHILGALKHQFFDKHAKALSRMVG